MFLFRPLDSTLRPNAFWPSPLSPSRQSLQQRKQWALTPSYSRGVDDDRDSAQNPNSGWQDGRDAGADADKAHGKPHALHGEGERQLCSRPRAQVPRI